MVQKEIQSKINEGRELRTITVFGTCKKTRVCLPAFGGDAFDAAGTVFAHHCFAAFPPASTERLELLSSCDDCGTFSFALAESSAYASLRHCAHVNFPKRASLSPVMSDDGDAVPRREGATNTRRLKNVVLAGILVDKMLLLVLPITFPLLFAARIAFRARFITHLALVLESYGRSPIIVACSIDGALTLLNIIRADAEIAFESRSLLANA